MTAEEVVARFRSLNPRLVGIDGLPCSGKTTLACRLESELGMQYLGLDEFVLPESDWPHERTPRYPFEYIRHDAFVRAVQTLARGEPWTFHPFDWTTGAIAKLPRTISARAPVVVDGVSALAPELAPLYDVAIYVESDEASMLEASLRRGVGEWERPWRDYFLPSVACYLQTQPATRASLIVRGRGLG